MTRRIIAGGAPWGAPPADRLGIGDRHLGFVFGVRLENPIANRVMSGRVDDRSEQRKAATLAVDTVGARRECDVSARASSAFPHAEADQLQPSQRRCVVEME